MVDRRTAPDRRERPLPFWVLQASELGAALALVEISLHVGRSAVLVGAAALLVGLAVTSRGPLGAVPLVPSRLHLVAVVPLAVLIGLAPALPALRPGISGIVTLALVAVGLVRLATLTRPATTRPRPAGQPTRTAGPGGRPDAATSLRPDAAPGAAAPSTGATPPPSAAPPGAGSGALVRAAGMAGARLARQARRAAALQAPEVRARLDHAARAAGRWTGRATGAAGRPQPESRGTPPAGGTDPA